MKGLVALLLAVATPVFAQDQGATKQYKLPAVPEVTNNVTVSVAPVSHADLYCAGFLTRADIPRHNMISGGLHSPNSVRFVQNDTIFITGILPPGTRISLVREARDPNQFEAFEGQRKAVEKAGQLYFDLGYAVVVENRDDTAVAQIEYSCEPAVPGDLAIPFVERAPVSVRAKTTLNRVPPRATGLTGRILQSRGFDMFIGNSHKVYLDVGSDNGVKVGDYFQVTRSFEDKDLDAADLISKHATELEDTQVQPSRSKRRKRDADLKKHMPRKMLGELVVLSVTPNTATAMVTFAVEDLKSGDRVEAERAPVASEGQSGSPKAVFF